MIFDGSLIRQFAKFGVVGVLNTALHYAVFYSLYSFLGINYLLSSGIGYTAGLMNSYVLNRNWTFRSRNTKRGGEFARFASVNLVSLGVNLVTLKMFVVWGGLKPEVAQVCAIAFSLSANFVGNRFWTFNSARNGCA